MPVIEFPRFVPDKNASLQNSVIEYKDNIFYLNKNYGYQSLAQENTFYGMPSMFATINEYIMNNIFVHINPFSLYSYNFADYIFVHYINESIQDTVSFPIEVTASACECCGNEFFGMNYICKECSIVMELE
jgi:hypothetical protein